MRDTEQASMHCRHAVGMDRAHRCMLSDHCDMRQTQWHSDWTEGEWRANNTARCACGRGRGRERRQGAGVSGARGGMGHGEGKGGHRRETAASLSPHSLLPLLCAAHTDSAGTQQHTPHTQTCLPQPSPQHLAPLDQQERHSACPPPPPPLPLPAAVWSPQSCVVCPPVALPHTTRSKHPTSVTPQDRDIIPSEDHVQQRHRPHSPRCNTKRRKRRMPVHPHPRPLRCM